MEVRGQFAGFDFHILRQENRKGAGVNILIAAGKRKQESGPSPAARLQSMFEKEGRS